VSKAFTKESDADDDDGPELAPLPGGSRNLITPEGWQALQDELKNLLRVERPKVVETVSWAAGNGDRSENGDYIYGKRRLREIDRRIRFLTKRLEIAQIVDPALQKNRDQVFFGARVTYADGGGEERVVRIVGVDETARDSQGARGRSGRGAHAQGRRDAGNPGDRVSGLSRQSRLDARQRAREGRRIVGGAREDERPLDARDRVEGFGARFGGPAAGDHQRARDRLDPALEIRAYAGRETLARVGQREQAERADATAGAEFLVDRAAHFGEARARFLGVARRDRAQRGEHVAFEPRIGFRQRGIGHLGFAAGEEVIKAAFTQTGRRGDVGQCRRRVAALAEQLGELGQKVGAFGEDAGHRLIGKV
jgi:transcription elongation factor GreB